MFIQTNGSGAKKDVYSDGRTTMCNPELMKQDYAILEANRMTILRC